MVGGQRGLYTTHGTQVYTREGPWCKAAQRLRGEGRSGGGPRRTTGLGKSHGGGKVLVITPRKGPDVGGRFGHFLAGTGGP